MHCATSFKYPSLYTSGVKRPDGFNFSRRSNRRPQKGGLYYLARNHTVIRKVESLTVHAVQLEPSVGPHSGVLLPVPLGEAELLADVDLLPPGELELAPSQGLDNLGLRRSEVRGVQLDKTNLPDRSKATSVREFRQHDKT